MSRDSSLTVLLPPAPLERLLMRLDHMSSREFRQCTVLATLVQRRIASRLGEPAALLALARRLSFLTERGVLRSQSVAFSLNLCRERMRWESKLRGPDTRVSRKVLHEELLLLKREYQALQHLKPRFPLRSLQFGVARKVEVVAYIDASIKSTISALGIMLQNAEGTVLAEITLASNLRHSDEAECDAALSALNTAKAFGATAVRLCTDSDAILDLLSEPARIHQPMGFRLRTRLKSEIATCTYVEVIRVPRAFNHASDRLAASLSEHVLPIQQLSGKIPVSDKYTDL